MIFLSLAGDNTLSWLKVGIRHCSSWFFLMFFPPTSLLHFYAPWSSAQLSLVALNFPYSRLFLFNSGSVWVPLPAPQPENTLKWWIGANHSFHLISFPLSVIIILYCLISSDLNSVVSHILSSLCGCFRQEYKSCPSCSFLTRGRDMIVPV